MQEHVRAPFEIKQHVSVDARKSEHSPVQGANAAPASCSSLVSGRRIDVQSQ